MPVGMQSSDPGLRLSPPSAEGRSDPRPNTYEDCMNQLDFVDNPNSWNWIYYVNHPNGIK